MKKNVASQVIGAQMVAAADGSAFTGTVSVAVTIDGGTQAAGGGTGPTHEGNGFHSYLPTQGETNGDHVAFTFTGTGAVPVTVQVYTSFPQTGDSFARLGAPAGADIAADIAAIEAQTDDIGAAGAGLTAVPWNAAWDAEVQSEVADALGVYDPPTHAELTAEVDAVQADIAALENLSAAQVNAEVVDALATDTYAEPSAVPASTDTLAAKLGWIAAFFRNKVTQSTTTQALRNDADSADIATAAVSDDGSTFTRGEFS